MARHTTTKLKHVVKRLQKSLFFSCSSAPIYEEGVGSSVKKGHFVVVATDHHEGEAKRFIIDMKYLKHPCFLRLLEQAAEEFGFDQEGAIAVPCRPRDLERILIHGEEVEEEDDQ